MGRFLTNCIRAIGRVFPACVTLGQAIAFNMFVVFFPMLLLAMGLLSGTSIFHAALREIPERLNQILPFGTSDVVSAYFMRKGIHSWRWISLGLLGTLIAGTQVMVGYIEGFRIIEGDLLQQGYWRRQARALGLLCLTLAPMLAVVILTVFGKQMRPWIIRHTGLPHLVRSVGFLFYVSIVFLLAMLVLVLIYRIGRPAHGGWRKLLPGAGLATALWWGADIFFGLYVRKMPYDRVYGGLAAAIGLLLWMYLTALIVLLGAAYNAVARESAALPDARDSNL